MDKTFHFRCVICDHVKMPKIHEKFVFLFKTVEPLTFNEPNFRILKHILNSRDDLHEFLTSEYVRISDVLNRSLYCFLFVIECIDDEIASNIVTNFCENFKDSCVKPMLIEVLVGSTTHALFIYDGDRTSFPDNSLIYHDENHEECNKRLEEAVEKSKPLTIRLFKCFDVTDDQVNERLMKKLVCGTCMSSMRAFLNLPLLPGYDEPPILSGEMATLLNYEYEMENYQRLTLLMIACEKNNYDAVVLLSKFMNINQTASSCDRTASDYATTLKILIFLLENDAKFPLNFSETYTDHLTGTELEKRRIEEIVSERTKFHDDIEGGRVNEVIQLFRENNPTLMFAYKYTTETLNQTKSQSAVLTALSKVNDDFKTVKVLQANGFNFNKDDELNKNEKSEILTGVLNRLHKEQPNHINFILCKSRIIPGKGQQYLECYNKLKETLISIDNTGMGAILKLIEYSYSFSVIVVDFYNKHVAMSPNAGVGFEGYTDHHAGHMFVNTKKTLADVLVHECCHLALYVLFQNACKPYCDFDDDSQSVFKNIVDQVRARLIGNREKSEEELILLQTYECYLNEADWPKELIARVPQLIVMGRAQFLRDKYGELLDFFEEKVLAFMRKVTENPENLRIKIEVEKLNDFLRHFKQIEERKRRGVWTNNNKFVKKAQQIRHIECRWPRLYLANIYETMIEPMKRKEMPTKFYILTCIEDFVCNESRKKIKRICDRSTAITLIINCEHYDVKHLNSLRFIKTFASKFVTVGVDEHVKDQIGHKHKRFCETVTYTWDDIDASSRKHLLQVSVNFQGYSFTASELIGDKTELIPLERVLNGTDIVIENQKPKIDHYDEKTYVERKFEGYSSVDSALSLINDKHLLLIDSAGSGKSIELAHSEAKIKEKHPKYWVTRKSLQEMDDYLSESLTVEQFLKLCVNPSDIDFQEKLLIEFYKKSSVILLLDAVDELEKNRGAFLKLLKKLNGNVHLFITAQPDLSKHLQKCLPETSAVLLKLEPFSEKDHVDCVNKIWENNPQWSKSEVKEELRSSAEALVSSFLESAGISAENFGLPLITTVLAETCAGNKYQYTSIFELFTDFVRKNDRRTMNEKPEATNEQFAANMMKNINDQYRWLALKYLFRFQSKYRFSFDDDAFKENLTDIDLDYLQRSGLIVVVDDNKYIFVHSIFAIFFAAIFVIKSLRKKESLRINKDLPNEDFPVAMDVLLTVSKPPLIKFIDDGFRKFGSDIDKRMTAVHKYFQNQTIEMKEMKKMKERKKERMPARDSASSQDSDLEPDEEMYRFKFFNCMFKYIESNAYHIAIFLTKCIPITIRSILPDDFNTLFDFPHKFFSFFLAATLFTNNSEIARKILTTKYKDDIFQHIFLRFPSDILDAVTDNTDFNNLIEVMYRPKSDITLPPIDERFEKSTLKLLVNTANKHLHENERKNLLKPRNGSAICWKFTIGADYFESKLDMNLMAMKELGYSFTSWYDLMTNTLFDEIVRRLFMNENENKFIMRFYHWAHATTKVYPTMRYFRSAIIATFVRHFGTFGRNYDASELLQFIRETMKINITDALKDHANEVILKFSTDGIDPITFGIWQKYFTAVELAQLVTKNADDGTNVVSEYIVRVNAYGVKEILKLQENRELDGEKLKRALNASRSSTLCQWLYSTATYRCPDDLMQHWRVEEMFKVIENWLNEENLKKAIQYKCGHGTIFHAAAKRRDLFVLKKVWHIAHNNLSDEEFKALLMVQNSDGFSM